MSRAARRRAGPALMAGAIVAGRFRIEDKLGEGGMAEVFRAEDLATSRRVAVKVLHPEIATNPEAVERTKREGQVLSELDNPAIVSVETFGQLEDGTVFLVMELLEGETLGERMRRGPLDAPELAPVVAGTCAGLHAAHAKGIVHRDLKPDNIFLCPTEHGLQVKLLDFGISKVYGGEKLTQTGEILGTPRYMSPEQLGAEPDIDARVDVYALGVILYEALAGKPPFLATTPTDLIIAILNGKVAPLRSARPDTPAAVEGVVMRAFSKVRAARYDTAMELATAYVDAVGGASAVRGQQRRGMATRAFGGARQGGSSIPPPMDAVPDTRPPPAPIGKDSVAGNLRLGTFSGTAGLGSAATIEAPARPVAAPIAAPIAPLGGVRSIPPTSTEDHLPYTRESPMADVDGGAEPVRRVAATAMMDASHPMMQALTPASGATGPRPTAPARRRARARGVSKLLLVLGALVAGAASAAAVIAGLHLYRKSQAEPPAVLESATPAEVTPTDVTPAEVTPAEVTPVGIEPPPVEEADAEPAPEPEAAVPHRGRAGRRSDTGHDPTPDEPPEDPEPTGDDTPVLPGFGGSHDPRPTDPDPPSSVDPLRAARDALRAGEPQRCVQILDDAIRGGAPAIALRRRGDCYEAAGQRQAAIQDYQRFCRLVPDHPTISELRPLLEGWGRSCP